MKIFEYSAFLLEKKVSDLLLEAKIEYYKDFEKVLQKIDHPIADDLLELIGKDIDVTTNLLDIGDAPGAVKFYNTNQIGEEKWEIVNNGQTYTKLFKLYKFVFPGYEGDGSEFGTLPNGTRGKLIKIWDHTNTSGLITISYVRVCQFLSDDGKTTFISPDGLKKVRDIKGKPQETFIGRLSQRLLSKVGKKYKPKEIEEFVNKFKSQVEILRDKFSLFELVKGEDIKYWYLGSRYSSKYHSTLQQSCMRHQQCQSFFDVYVENEEKVSLLILKDEDDEDKISGRAIIWKLDDGRTFMDRIYYSKAEEVELFKSYASKEGWICKSLQNSDPYSSLQSPDGKIIYEPDEAILIVSLNVSFDEFPYMDTMRYLYMNNGRLSNRDLIKPKDLYTLHSDYSLDNTEGTLGCEVCGGSDEVECHRCEGSGEVDCDECNGKGEVDCDICDGEGDLECGECNGEGEIEGSDGEMEECSDCSGRGRTTCDECHRGKISCGECDGDGDVGCPTCDGNRTISCPECS
jgi:hypothetical protein